MLLKDLILLVLWVIDGCQFKDGLDVSRSFQSLHCIPSSFQSQSPKGRTPSSTAEHVFPKVSKVQPKEGLWKEVDAMLANEAETADVYMYTAYVYTCIYIYIYK